MIRALHLICCECQQPFDPNGKLYYRDNFISKKISDTDFLCPECIDKWKEKWHIKNADFFERDCSLYVNIALEDGSVYNNLDCTPLDDIVVTSEEIPLEGQQVLFVLYQKWDNERKQNILKECMFMDEFMRTCFTCETYGGERYENIGFRFNMQGRLETEKQVPEYILDQIINAWEMHKNQSVD